jgi:hypothetical protein
VEEIEVIARFERYGRISPKSFTWRGMDYPVISIGRSWQDDAGQHILVMVPGDQVFELVFEASKGLWWLRLPRKVLTA